MEGLEPPRLAAPDPKSGTATNYATSGSFKKEGKGRYFFKITEKKGGYIRNLTAKNAEKIPQSAKKYRRPGYYG